MRHQYALAASLIAVSMASGPSFAQDNIVNIYNWSDYIGADINDEFTRISGVSVNYDVYDSAEMAVTKLLAGTSGYDVTVVSGGALVDLIDAGIPEKLDPAKLPNLKNLDPAIVAASEAFDPGNQYSVPYSWGTTGIAYNAEMVAERAPDAPTDSLSIIFDPEWVSKFADCGVVLLDAPQEILPIALNYLGLDPYSESPDDYAKAGALLDGIRPYIRYFNSSLYVDDLANGDICLAIGWSGDAFIARDRAAEADNGVTVGYSIPKEGTLAWIDNFIIPADAEHKDNAYAYINFMLDPDVSAENIAEVHTATPNAAALLTGKVPAEDRENVGIYPPAEVMSKLFGEKKASIELKRLRNRLWTSLKSGQ
ncbi:MAG: extracellular solute-binding protein [Hyphomicrobiaceae bacterium]|nr:extracellular solute-binding protein [Hyphomicrobiaceae bacterium]